MTLGLILFAIGIICATLLICGVVYLLANTCDLAEILIAVGISLGVVFLMTGAAIGIVVGIDLIKGAC